MNNNILILFHDAYSPISLSQSTYFENPAHNPRDLVKLKYPLMTAGLLGWRASSPKKSQLGRV